MVVIPEVQLPGDGVGTKPASGSGVGAAPVAGQVPPEVQVNVLRKPQPLDTWPTTVIVAAVMASTNPERLRALPELELSIIPQLGKFSVVKAAVMLISVVPVPNVYKQLWLGPFVATDLAETEITLG
jgi:hypothetical protein